MKTLSSFTCHSVCNMPIINEGYWLIIKLVSLVQHTDIRRVHVGNDNCLFDKTIMKDSNQNQ